MDRLQLQALLELLLGSTNVYFQPPAGVQMQYPAIVYEWDDTDTRFADNRPYRHIRRYQVTVIDRDPDSVIPDKVADLPMCTFNRAFSAEDLNHKIFDLYF
jgi:hypothetical protein